LFLELNAIRGKPQRASGCTALIIIRSHLQ
jgi:hypothetical protein